MLMQNVRRMLTERTCEVCGRRWEPVKSLRDARTVVRFCSRACRRRRHKVTR